MAHLQKLFTHCLTQIKTTPHIGWLCLIIFVATILRIWQLNTHAIFFGDAAHDVISAHQALENRQQPLLGIESSVPRFRQGPLAVWINMFGLVLFGNSLLALSLLYAVVSIAAVVALYETTTLAINQKTALAASAFLAFSPLAIAHGRMPYHITPIPLAMVLYLWSIHRVTERKTAAVFWSAFAWGILFQFELATAPLILLIAYALWRSKQLWRWSNVVQIGFGTTVALLPQIVYDLTHSFKHLGGFALWVVYRVASFGLGGSHHFSFSKLGSVVDTFSLYVGRMWLVDQSMASTLVVAVTFVIVALVTWMIIHNTKVPRYIELTVVATWILVGAYIIHGSPSEAYMPPFLVLLPLVIAYWWQTLNITRRKMLLAAWLVISLINIGKIAQANWFVSTTHAFSYGPGSGEQQDVLIVIAARYQDFAINTTDPGGIFPNYLDNYRWWLIEKNLTLDPSSQKSLYIDLKPTSLVSYPNTIITTLQTTQIVEIYDQF